MFWLKIIIIIFLLLLFMFIIVSMGVYIHTLNAKQNKYNFDLINISRNEKLNELIYKYLTFIELKEPFDANDVTTKRDISDIVSKINSKLKKLYNKKYAPDKMSTNIPIYDEEDFENPNNTILTPAGTVATSFSDINCKDTPI